MCFNQTKQGFTLIELLVVVLIIGILAAVALPQYQKAVAKSRFATMLPLVKALRDAKVTYYLQNGTNARRFDQLDVDLPANVQVYENDWYGQDARFPNFSISLDAQVTGDILLSGAFFDGSNILWYMSTHGEQNQCCGTTGKLAEQICKEKSNTAGTVSGGETCYFF